MSQPEAPKLNLDIFLEESKVDDSQPPQSNSLARDQSESEIQPAMSGKVQMQDDDSDLSIDFQDLFTQKRKPQQSGQERADVESRVGMKFISKQKAKKLEGRDIQDQLLIAKVDHDYDADSDSFHGRARGAQNFEHRGEQMREKDAEILVVEDNLFCSYALISILQQYQIDCDVARNGEEAIQRVTQRRNRDGTTYKLVIMDLKLPIIDGFEASIAIRSIVEEGIEEAGQVGGTATLAQPYICLLTSNCSNDVKKKARQIGLNEVLIKPIFKLGIQKLLYKARLISN